VFFWIGLIYVVAAVLSWAGLSDMRTCFGPVGYCNDPAEGNRFTIRSEPVEAREP
jgi:hypothetical protein